MATLVHELWDDGEGRLTFCLAGPMGDRARALLGPGASLLWEVEADTHFEAMTLYYQHVGRGTFASDQAWDREPYPEEWRRIQRGRLRSPSGEY